MRIKDHEYKDIVEALENRGFTIDDFDFIKKKGWFHLIRRSSSQFFSFHRKLETQLIQGEFRDSLTYRIKTDSGSEETDNWDKTRGTLEEWLKAL